MRRSPTVRQALWAASGAATLVGAGACVDLFHATDFATLCELDASACTSPDSSTADAGGPDAAANIDFCSLSSPRAREIADHACGWLGACLGTIGTFGDKEGPFAACMMQALAAYDCAYNPTLRPRGESATLWQCLSKVSSCGELNRCVFGSVDAPRCQRTSGGTFTACNADPGSVLVECGTDERPFGMTVCALSGRSCTKVDSSKGVCAGKQGANCTGSPRCEGTFAIACATTNGGIPADEGTNCDLVGDGRCVADSNGIACAPDKESADTCSATSKVVCNHKQAESCVDGRRVRFRCETLNMDCDVAAANPADACRVTSQPCNDTVDSCQNGKLHSCSRGKAFDLDCESVNLGSCTPQTGGRPATCGEP